MLEITGQDIALLNDGDLRDLVGRLCEATVRKNGFPTSAVTWSGNQNAPDGGIDVRVALAANTATSGFVPRPATGFQVKTPDMPPNAILAEMQPSGSIRPSIQELADQGGAYIIVSSASVSDSALTNRRSAMPDAIKGIPNDASLALDFYDRTRLATWVSEHAGLIPWVRSRIGKSIPGWQGYGAWAHAPEGANDEYLLDDKLRIRIADNAGQDEIPPLEGMQRLRALLREPGTVVRLVGLSGVGKTRLVQALFDSRVGDGALDPSSAIYTDIADDPDPQPTSFASDLIAAQTRAILVIDNCSPELHRRVSEVSRKSGSSLSVITIEYDIREDGEPFSRTPSPIVWRKPPFKTSPSRSSKNNFSMGRRRAS